MIRFSARIFLLFCCLMTGVLNAQNTMSPYSVFGPGELQSKGFGRSFGMGHSGMALPSDTRLNNLNPASYVGIDSLHFILEIGTNAKYSGFRSGTNSLSGLNANLAYLAMGFRITRWWANSLGITPFSHVGYDITSQNFVEGSSLKYVTEFKGSGGISLAYWSNSLRITKNLSVGINTSYIFGPLVQEEYISQSELSASYIFTRNDYFHSFYFDYGAQYHFRIKNLMFFLGATYANRQNLYSGYSSTLETSGLSSVDSKEGQKGVRGLPETFGGALAVSNSKVTLAVDYQLQKWKGLKYPTMMGAFRDASNFSAGVDLKPWKESVSNKFFQNWNYRAGFNYRSSYLQIKNNPVNSYSVTLGLGIPLRNQYSQINFAVEAGQQGTTVNGLIREKYVMAHLNFTVNELWFIGKTFF